jgi:hypothetical protein
LIYEREESPQEIWEEERERDEMVQDDVVVFIINCRTRAATSFGKI